MNYAKAPLTSQEHLTNLQKRGLNISDHAKAAEYLEALGYYRLSAYFIPFELPNTELNRRNHNFKEGTQFQEVLSLYVFDRKLRLLVMEAIERIEVAIRSKWANELAQATNDPHAFMCNEYFINQWEHQRQLTRVANNIQNSSEVFVTHYLRKYSTPYLPPIWAMTETLTIGQLSKWVANTNNNPIKKSIALSLGIPTIEIFDSALQCISLIRNICAHHGRLWDRHLIKRLANFRKLNHVMQFYPKEVHQKDGTINTQRHLANALYNYLVIISHVMLTIQPNTSWQQRLVEHLKTATDEQQIIMGFPNDWQEHSFFQQGAQ